MSRTTRRKTDIAILEQRYGDKWRTLTYIGPGRNTTMFLPKKVMTGGSIKVRYFEVDEGA